MENKEYSICKECVKQDWCKAYDDTDLSLDDCNDFILINMKIKIYTLYALSGYRNEVINSEFFFTMSNSISKETISELYFTRMNIREALLL